MLGLSSPIQSTRQYQQQICSLAWSGNSVVVAGDRSSSMSIAVTLAEAAIGCRQESLERTSSTIAVVLASTTAKAASIFSTLDGRMSATIRMVGGRASNDTSERLTWTHIFSKTQVLVTTPQFFLGLLQRNYYRLEDAALLVFDDCHLAHGSHPYRLIMDEFYRSTQISRRPRILGMTYSPPHTTLLASMLATTLDARFIVLSPSVVKRGLFESILTYSTRPPKCSQEVTALIRRLIQDYTGCKPMFCAFSRILNQMGPWAACQAWIHFLSTETPRVESRADKSMASSGLQDNTLKDVQSVASLRLDFSTMSNKAKGLILLIKDAMSGTSKDTFRGIVLVGRRLEAYTLCSLLRQAAQSNTFGLQGLSPNLLLGQATQAIGSIGMIPGEQHTVLREFVAGKCNLLVATSAIDEALDIPRCDLVVRFNPPPTFASYLRSRCLTRDENAMHIIMQPIHQRNSLELLQGQITEIEEWCKRHRPESLTEMSLLRLDDSQQSVIDTAPSAQFEFVVPATGARLMLSNSLATLQLFCSSLSGGKETLYPEFSTFLGSNGYTTTASLPQKKAPGIQFTSMPMPTESLAKKSAALEACKVLHHRGYLDDDLFPVQVCKHAKVDVSSPPTLMRPSKAAEEPWHDLENDVPSFWTANSFSVAGLNMLCMTVFMLQECDEDRKHRPIAILTRAQIASVQTIDVYFDGRPSAIDVYSMKHRIPVGGDELRIIYEFYARVAHHIHRKPVDVGNLDGAWYAFVPLVKGFRSPSCFSSEIELRALIDWDEMRAVVSADTDVAVDSVPYHTLVSKADDMTIFERSMRTRVYYTKAVRRDEKEYMILRQKLQEEIQGLNSVHLLLLEPMPEYCHHAIISVEGSILVDNFLQTDSKPKKTIKRDRKHLLSDQCCLMPLSATVSRAFHLVPSILLRLDAFVLANAFRDTLHIPKSLKSKLTLPILLEALTASAAGMSMDYQRLEMLGDTFFKFVTTTDFYIRCPMSDEGNLTAMRRDAIQNKTLFDLAMAVGLPRYATTFPLQTFHFEQSLYRHVPSDEVRKPTAVNASVITSPLLPPPPRNARAHPIKSPIKAAKHVSFRLIADMVESVVGAAYVSGGLDLGLHMTRHFGHPISPEVQRWGDFATLWDARVDAIKKDLASPKPEIKRLHPLSLTAIMPLDTVPEVLAPIDYRQLEHAIGYQFRDKRNLIEALADTSLAKGYTYERLEFLGDAVLDMMTVQYWFKRCSQASEGVLSVMKTESVNSQTLGAVSLMMGLHRHLQRMNPSLISEWDTSMTQLTDALNLRDLDTDDLAGYDDLLLPPLPAHGVTESGIELSFEAYVPYLHRRARVEQDHEWPPFWTSMKVPKTTGDLYEALVGAIYQDARFTYEAPCSVFDRTLLVVMDLFLSPTTHQRHPIKTLIEGLQRLGCSKGTIHTVGSALHTSKKKVERRQASRTKTPPSEMLSHGPPYVEYLVTFGPSMSDRIASSSPMSATEDDEGDGAQQRRSDSEAEDETEQRATKRVRLSPNRDTLAASSSPLASPPPTPTVVTPTRRHRTAEFVLHDQVILRATDLVLPEARKVAARRGFELVTEHTELLDLYCTCPLRAKLKQKAVNKHARQQRAITKKR